MNEPVSLAQLGAEVRARRTAAGLTVQEVAGKLAVGQSTIFRLEKGKSDRVKVQTLAALTDLFGIDETTLRGLIDSDKLVEQITRVRAAQDSARSLVDHFTNGIGDQAPLVAMKDDHVVKFSAPLAVRDELVDALRAAGFIVLRPA